LVGLLLAAVTLRTRSLWLAIGLHAGWILGQQGFLTVARFRVKPEDAMLPWVGPNLVSGAVPTGLIPVAVLVFSAAIVWLWVRRR
jgi:membrane protease YdiL (CAAX protease family)